MYFYTSFRLTMKPKLQGAYCLVAACLVAACSLLLLCVPTSADKRVRGPGRVKKNRIASGMLQHSLRGHPIMKQVQVGKTGSSSVRAMLTYLQTHSHASRRVKWLCDNKRRVKWLRDKRNCWISAPDHNDGCNSTDMTWVLNDRPCNDDRQSCSYVVTLREPISRLISEYNYFCLQCLDSGKFCLTQVGGGLYHGREKTWLKASTCPHMSFEDWASNHSNQYVHHFSRFGNSSHLSDGSYYRSYMAGFQDQPLLTESDVEKAAETLSANNMILIWTDELNSSGWERIAATMEGTPASAAGARLMQWRSGSMPAVEAATMESASRANNRASSYTFYPTDAQKQRACKINALDCKLYAALRSGTGQTCAC